jgi:serine/threonine-protein kinase
VIERLAAALADRYRIERELGAGGMATVYLALDLKHDRKVAIKVLRQEVAESLGRDRFLREIQLAAKLSHPHILALHDSGEACGALYYVMPNVEGQSLRDGMDAGRLSVDDAVRIAQEVAGALDYAHRHDVVHRDIKPENIMLQDGHALVADFGIGKALSDVVGDALTQVGVSVGTPAYMSPEQAVGEAVDGRTDIYSLGCVLYEMLVGEPPFTGPNVQAVIAKRFVQTPADVTALREGVSRSVARAVQKALARTPIDRFETAAQFVAALTETDRGRMGRAVAPAQSIAVLPFENMSTDPESEFFGDGIAEDIINALTRIDGLQVAARTSAFSFKGSRVDFRAIGEKLSVATVLEGSVRKAGKRLRITAQLISVADGYHLWSERYDRDMTDVFAVQDEIATAIARKLQLTLVRPAPDESVPVTPTEVEAYELTIRGRALARRRGRDIIVAVDCLRRAIALAPEYAVAHAGLGEALRVYVQYGFGSAAEIIPQAKAALRRALELDPGLADALGVLAIIHIAYEADATTAFELWDRAFEINPKLSEIRALRANWGFIVARHDDARGTSELERAVADDPLSAICATTRALGLAFMGRYDEAVAEARRAREVDPTAYSAQFASAWILTWARDLDAAFEIATATAEQSSRHPFVLQVMTGLYMMRGDPVRADAIHQELVARSCTTRIPEFSLAVSALYLGRADEAMDHALRSVELFDAIGPIWPRMPDTDALKSHRLYPDLRRRLGI